MSFTLTAGARSFPRSRSQAERDAALVVGASSSASKPMRKTTRVSTVKVNAERDTELRKLSADA
jgi:hypothetical protein